MLSSSCLRSFTFCSSFSKTFLKRKLSSSFSGNEVAIITGASSGIGAGTALKLAQKGVNRFCLSGRNIRALEETKAMCIDKSDGKISDKDVLLVNGELTERSVCEDIVQSTVDRFNQIDILVNSAGIISTGAFESVPIDAYDTMMDINVRSVVLLTQLCIPHLKKTKGSIVNVSSVNGIRSFANVGFYCMSKAAIDMYTRCLALELAQDGVRVNAVNPGVTVTNLQKRGGMGDEQYAQFLERCKETHALGRPGEVEEVANAIAFLASEESSFMTGNLTPVDGGRNCLCPR